MSIEAQIEELRAELFNCGSKRERTKIARELQAKQAQLERHLLKF
ncbi:hypothetical protein [Novosphingobium rosa]|nr:hypothetical protein [Novosphingobium rosa]